MHDRLLVSLRHIMYKRDSIFCFACIQNATNSQKQISVATCHVHVCSDNSQRSAKNSGREASCVYISVCHYVQYVIHI